MEDKPILLFDGVCNLCNGFVQFILLRDPRGVFRFASLQSDTGQLLLEKYGLDSESLNTVVLIKGGKAYTHSEVALEVAPQLQGFWQWVALFRLVPRSVRDAIYNWIAKNRYKWFGKQDACMLPRAEWKARFL
jgi:predicted DCC family thiol-disulfide oxidoreductase YuxK